MRRPAAAWLLAACAAAYALAAWGVRPGFFDGFAPQQPYNWVTPPPGIPNNGGAPQGGSCTVPVLNGTVEPGTCFTNDGQAILSFVPGAFAVPSGGGSLTISIRPVSSYPAPSGFSIGTNVYLVTANSTLAKTAVITLRYSDLEPAPGFIYVAAGSGGGWKNIGSSGVAAPFTIAQRTTEIGYIAAGYPGQKAPPNTPTVAGGQTLPIIVAIVIVIVILAGVPLALLRRRGAGEEEDLGEPEE